MSAAESDALVAALARATVERAAPEELPLFRGDERGVLHRPEGARAERRQGRDARLRSRRRGGAPDSDRAHGREGRARLPRRAAARARPRAGRGRDRQADRAVREVGRRRGRGRGRARPHRRAAGAGARARDREGPRAEALGRAGRRCSRTRSSGASRRHERRGGGTGAPSPPESVRLPVRHGLPLRPARRGGARGQPLRLAVDRRAPSRSAASTVAGALECLAISPADCDEHSSSSRRVDRRVLRAASHDALPLPGLVDARRHGRAPPRRPPRSCSRLRSGSRAGASCGRSRRPMRRPWSTRSRSSRASRTSTRRASIGTRSTRRPAASRSDTRVATASRSAAGSSSSRRPTRRRSAPSSGTSSRTSGTATSGSRTSRLPSGTRSCSSPCSRSSSPCSTTRDTLTNVTARLAVLALLVYLTRNAVLRSREVYADLRASVPDGPAGALRRVLAGLPPTQCRPASAGCEASTPIPGAAWPRSTTRGRSSRSAPSSRSRPA